MDSIEKSFKAQLLCVTDGYHGPVTVAKNGSGTKQGWLVLGDREEPGITFDFEYLDRTDTRIIFAIRGAEDADPYQNAPLDVSLNGYVGFYPSVDEPAPWRLEVTQEDSDGKPLRCLLRDSYGQRIAILSKVQHSGSRADAYVAYRTDMDYLNVKDGVIAEFQIQYQD